MFNTGDRIFDDENKVCTATAFFASIERLRKPKNIRNVNLLERVTR